MQRCKTCGEERPNEYFYSYFNNSKIYYSRNKCKLCSGVKKVRDRFGFNPDRLETEYDKRKMYLLLKRLQLTNGLASESDIINLTACYSELYGNSIPFFNDRIDVYVFMWEKLKEFSESVYYKKD